MTDLTSLFPAEEPPAAAAPAPTLVVPPTMPYVDVNKLHEKHAPAKTLGNFWRSDGFKAAEQVLTNLGTAARYVAERPAGAKAASTMVHPLVALEFFRWVSANLHQERLYKALFS